jgi:hypothetical protein
MGLTSLEHMNEIKIVLKTLTQGGLLALGYGNKRRLRKKRKNVNCAEDTVIVIGSK